MNPGDPILSGQLLVGIPIALLAGFLSFVSPCVLPLVPGYLGFVGGTTDSGRSARGRTVLGALLFVLGFAVVFIATGGAAGAIGAWLVYRSDLIIRILGVIVIVLGLAYVGLLQFLQVTKKLPLHPKAGLWGAPILGLVFAIGWTPCTGPTLAAINSVSIAGGSAWQGALLGFVYALGLGLPFIVLAVGFGWASRSVGFLRRHIRAINIVGGIMLILVGVLMVAGVWPAILSFFINLVPGYVSPV